MFTCFKSFFTHRPVHAAALTKGPLFWVIRDDFLSVRVCAFDARVGTFFQNECPNSGWSYL
jgi:hypothetical protein